MSINVNKYVKKERSFFDFIRYRYLKHKRKFFKIYKKVFCIIWEFIYYSLIFLIGNTFLYSEENILVPQFLLITIYIMSIVLHKNAKRLYKYWEELALYDKFQEKFIREYKLPLLFPQLILLFVIAKYCNTGCFLILFTIIHSYDLWERRYITNDIKQDMIINKLNKDERA